jgi:hypothetical protein
MEDAGRRRLACSSMGRIEMTNILRLERSVSMFFKRNFWLAITSLIGVMIFSACSDSGVDSDSQQHPGERPTYLVSFDTSGAQERAAITVYEGDNLETIVYPPYKEDFEFLGWSSDPDLFVSYDLSAPVLSDLTLYAAWSGARETAPGKHRLNVHLNGGAFKNVPLQVLGIDFTEGQTLKQLPRVNGTPDHSTLVFASWNTKADGRGEIIWDDTPLTEDTDIYAIYGISIKNWKEMTENIQCGNPDAVYIFQNDPKYINPATCPNSGPFTGFNNEWTPLCQDPNVPFKGHLYGSSTICYKINNVADRAGFFAYADGALIAGVRFASTILDGSEYMGTVAAVMKNSRLERVSVTSTFYDNRNNNIYSGGITAWGDNLSIKDSNAGADTYGMKGKNVGGVAGYLSGTFLDNVSGGGLITPTSADSRAGGLVGHMAGGGIKYAEASSQIDSAYSDSYAGVFVGFAEDVELSMLTSGSTARVSINGDDSFGGGIVGGALNSTVQGARIYGTVKADFGDRSAVGGIAGKITNGSIKETLLFTDDITADGASAQAGGIAGVTFGAEIANNLFIGKDMLFSRTRVSSVRAPSAGPVIGAAPLDMGSNNYVRSGVLINSVPYSVPGSSRDFKAIRGARGFFNSTLGWDFENNEVWEMLDYYDYPTFKAEHAEAFIPISTVEEFVAISGPDRVGSTNGSPTLEKNYVLVNNLDLSGYSSWKPIGVVTNVTDGSDSRGNFEGIFLGNGYTIRNLNGRSLFYGLTNATVRSLNIVNATTTESVLVSYRAAGTSVIEDVHVSASTITSSNASVGGILTEMINTCSVIESSFEGNITVSSSANSTTLYTGGILGSYNASGYIYKSYSAGSISRSRTGTSGAVTVYVGGIAGNAPTIEDCYSTASISAFAQTGSTNAVHAYAGGIAGRGGSSNSHYAGNSVQASANTTGTATTANITANAGGITGTSTAGTSNLSLTRNIQASVSGTNANITNARYGRIMANSSSAPVNNGNYGLTLATFGETLQDPGNNGDDVPGDAINVSFFETYMPNWDLTNTWYMADGMPYPTLRY